MVVNRRVFLQALLLAAPGLPFIRFAPGVAAQTVPPAPSSAQVDDKEFGVAIRYDGPEGADAAQSLLVADANATLPVGLRFEIRDVPAHTDPTTNFGRSEPVFFGDMMAWYHLPLFRNEENWTAQKKTTIDVDGYLLRGRFVSTGKGKFLLGQRKAIPLGEYDSIPFAESSIT